MIEIGEKPILWHIMKYYSQFGYNEFIICLGYKRYVVKEFFADYFLHTSDVTFDLANNSMKVHNNYSEPWKVTTDRYRIKYHDRRTCKAHQRLCRK